MCFIIINEWHILFLKWYLNGIFELRSDNEFIMDLERKWFWNGFEWHNLYFDKECEFGMIFDFDLFDKWIFEVIFVWKHIWFTCNLIYEMNISKISNNEVKFEIYEILKISFETWDIKVLKYIKNWIVYFVDQIYKKY